MESLQSRLAIAARASWPAVVMVVGVMVLLCVPPTGSNFYPRCPIYSMLGVECPGCGGTRALAALLHGHVAEALHFNALITLAFPVAFVYGAICYRRFLRYKKFRWPQLSPVVLYGMSGLAIAFTVLRNMPLHWL